MVVYAYAPKSVPAPWLYVKLTWVKELGLTWEDLGGIDADELSLLAEMISILHEAQGLKARVFAGGQG